MTEATFHTAGSPDPAARKAWRWGAFWLGIALGGFFDGILLHQVLQWHHLLSAVTVGPFGDLRWQIMADGLFHGVMYLVGLWGALRLYRGRASVAAPGAGRQLAAWLAIGFGVWHVVDAVLSHWVTGLHRIRMDVPNPLAWDIAWMVVFGIVPILVGYVLRRGGDGGGAWGRAGATLAVTLVGLAAWFNLFPARPASAGTLTVVLRPGADLGHLAPVLAASDARILWSDPAGGVWVLRPMGPVDRTAFFRAGAMFVSGAAGMMGCADWIEEGRRL